MKATAQHHSRNRRAGFTLVELMIVVAILGILASIALPLFKHYIYKARAGEATFTLAQIRAVEEEFRTDNGFYFSLSTSENLWFPANTVSPTQREYRWEASTEFNNWRQYGLVPPSRTSRFQYQVLAGTPENVSGFAASRGYTDGADHWFIARAHADLDGDSIEEGEEGYVTFEIYNLTDGIYINRDKGWE